MYISNDTRPILICGRIRTGTTFTRALMRTHPDIAVSDEFPIWRMPSLTSWFDEADKEFAVINRGKWEDRRAQIMRAIWFNFSYDASLSKGMHSRRYGNKTPGLERETPFYDKIFSKNPPLYVYNLRKGEDVFISRNNMPWKEEAPSIEKQLQQYLGSIRVIEAYKEKHPDRVYILQLDRIEASFEARLEVAKELFHFIGEKIIPKMMPFIRAWPNVHTTSDIRKETDKGNDRKELPREDKEYLESSEDYQKVLRKYGY